MVESPYFDVDDILAVSGMVEVESLMDCYHLDSLDAGTVHLVPQHEMELQDVPVDPEDPYNDEHLQEARKAFGVPERKLGKRCISTHIYDLPQGSKIKIPLWLAIDLQNKSFVKIEPVIWFSDEFKKILRASPETVNLGGKNEYYYEFGMKLCQNLNKGKSFFEFLSNAYFERMKKLIILILNLQENQEHSFLKLLTSCEMDSYTKCREFLRHFNTVAMKKPYVKTQLHGKASSTSQQSTF